MPYVVRSLGAVAFGIWVLANGVVGYLGLLDVGLSPTLTKKSAELVGSADPRAPAEINRVVSTVTVLYMALGLMLGLAIVLLGVVADRLFTIPAGDVGMFRAVLLIVGLQTAIGFPMSIWNALVCGLEDYHVLSALSVVSNLLRGALTVVLLRNGGGLLSLVWMGFGLSAFGWAVSRWWIYRRLPTLQIRAKWFDRTKLRDIVSFSGVMFVSSIAGYVLDQADRVLVGVFRPVSAVTSYEVGGRLSNYSRRVTHSWIGTILPVAAALEARKDRDTIRVVYLQVTKYLMASSAAVLVCLVAFGGDFIRLWMGPSFAISYRVMVILLFGHFYQSQNLVAQMILAGTNQIRTLRKVMIAYPIVVIALGVPMTAYGGLLGAAGAISLTIVVLESVFLRSILRSLSTTLLEFTRNCHWPVAQAVGASAAWATLISGWFRIPSWPALIFQVSSTLVVYVGSFCLLGMSTQERMAIVRRARGLVGLGAG